MDEMVISIEKIYKKKGGIWCYLITQDLWFCSLWEQDRRRGDLKRKIKSVNYQGLFSYVQEWKSKSSKC